MNKHFSNNFSRQIGLFSLMMFISLVAFGQTVRKPIPEDKLPIPDYYGLYAVTDKGLVEMKAGAKTINVNVGVEFIYYAKDAAVAETLQLFKVPLQSEGPQAPQRNKRSATLNTLNDSIQNTIADQQAVMSGLPRGSAQLEVHGKSISGKPEMVRLIPSDLLSSGDYQIGNRSGASSWYHFSVGDSVSSFSATATDSSGGANNASQSDSIVPAALQKTLAKAQAGDALAQFDLGSAYESGIGVDKDLTQALQWLRKAADQGYAEAQDNLAVMYIRGLGVNTNYSEAVEWLRKAADQGHSSAQRNLGWMYEHGNGVAQDYAESLNWYRKSAEKNPVNSSYVAWILATCPNASLRDSTNAEIFAQKAVLATNRKSSRALDVLAAAHANTGNFENAISTEKEAIALLKDEATKKDYESRLTLYESNAPYRMPPVSP